MPRAARWLRRRLPRRGSYLVTFGTIEILLGALTIAGAASPSPSAAITAYREVLPPIPWGAAQIVAGAICFYALARRQVLDRAGNTAMGAITMGAVGSALGYIYAAAATDGEDLRMAGAVAVWLLVARVHLLIAGWPEPPRIPTIDGDAANPTPVPFTQGELARIRAELEARGATDREEHPDR